MRGNVLQGTSRLSAWWCVALLLGCETMLRAEEADVCIYGGTSGGVTAAVQTARLGKTAIILEPTKHLGGMTSGGLSAVDIGDPRTVGGVAREYFTRLAGKYGKQLPWERASSIEGGAHGTGGAFAIEPHAAENLFEEFIREAGDRVRVIREARPMSVKKAGARLTEVRLADGRTISAKMFIDCSYEGDLLVLAGVRAIVGREANATYDETLNGFRISLPPLTKFGPIGPNGRQKDGRGAWMRTIALDPYVEPGKPESGLLPMISPNKMGTPGEAAPGVQAYCYRLCLTDDPANQLPIEPPADYDPRRYELQARYIAACLKAGDPLDMRWFCMPLALPNKKYDFNTAWLGANLPGAGWGWAEASFDERRKIAKQHENHQRGLIQFLRTDVRVPKNIRDEFARFGLPRDEFPETGGWPYQLYIREARRMVSDFVMTEHHAYGRKVAADPVALASYGVDAHEAQRIAHGGIVVDEGKLMGHGGIPGPYPVGYDAIVPRAEECENLFATFCISASHVCFASTRMEPVLMMLSQAASTAASLAIDDAVPVQKVDRSKLRARLLADGAILKAPAKAAKKAEEKDKAEKLPGAKESGKGKEDKQASEAQETTTSNAKTSKLSSALPTMPALNTAELAALAEQPYDLVVIGGTPGGIAMAVRAARQGMRVLLVERTKHLGGMITNGLLQWDALYAGHRAPLFSELLRNIEAHYRETYGADSHQLSVARYTDKHYPLGMLEPRVAEREFLKLVNAEKSLTLLTGYYLTAVIRDGALLRGVTLCEYQGSQQAEIRAACFADATYEADLAALAKVPYRVGREARAEFDEPHAGKIFVNILSGTPGSRDAVEGRLKLRVYDSAQGSIDPTSPQTADGAIQAYNFRPILTNDPENRVLLKEPPPNYRREEYLNYERRGLGVAKGPNRKGSFNAPILPGENHAYPEATWPERERITARHRDFALGLLWFLQTDESIPADKRRAAREIGLPRDEYPDNGHVPYEMYVREARRIDGRTRLTEHDGTIDPGLQRTPIHHDSIGITDWYMDSHACTTETRMKFKYDGKLILTEESRPMQIPYATLLPQGVDNLLVPVCLSATHVAWGAIRLEPVWMQTGESAGWAAVLAWKSKVTPAALDPDTLVRTLCERKLMVSFFNDVDAGSDEAWVRAVQYFGTRGFFPGYNARPDQPLKRSVAAVWANAFKELNTGKHKPQATARAVLAAHAADPQSEAITVTDFAALAGLKAVANDKPMTRAAACEMLWKALP